MRLACGLAIALWLSFPAAGMASRQQDPAGSTNAAGQAPAAPAPAPAENAPAEKSRTEPAPEEQVPAETTPAAPANPQRPAAEKRASGSVAKKKRAAGSASRTRKRRKRTAAAPDGTPRKIVVREGGASEPAAQIVPGITPAEAARQRQNAERLLGSTDDKLKRLAGSFCGSDAGHNRRRRLARSALANHDLPRSTIRRCRGALAAFSGSARRTSSPLFLRYAPRRSLLRGRPLRIGRRSRRGLCRNLLLRSGLCPRLLRRRVLCRSRSRCSRSLSSGIRGACWVLLPGSHSRSRE